MSATVQIKKIDLQSNIHHTMTDKVALEAPVNIFVNEEYVITLLSTPSMQEELAIGWLFTENVLQTIDQIAQILIDNTTNNHSGNT